MRCLQRLSPTESEVQGDVGSMVSRLLFFFRKPSSSFLANMKHDGISVLHGFAWEGGILEQVGTSTFKPGRGRDDEHFLNLTI